MHKNNRFKNINKAGDFQRKTNYEFNRSLSIDENLDAEMEIPLELKRLALDKNEQLKPKQTR